MKQIAEKNKTKLNSWFDIIICHPLENVENLIETLNLMVKLKDSQFNINMYTSFQNIMSKEAEKKLKLNSLYNYDRKDFHNSYYYFMMHLIHHLNKYNLGFLLPQEMKINFISIILNLGVFSKIYVEYIKLAYWNTQRIINSTVIKSIENCT